MLSAGSDAHGGARFMKFYTRKRRAPSVIIVSLIDILAILLIFFIVTTTFRINQPQLQINLPESKSAEQAPAEDNQPLVLRVKSAEEITRKPRRVTQDAARPSPSASHRHAGRPRSSFWRRRQSARRVERGRRQEHPRFYPTGAEEIAACWSIAGTVEWHQP